MVQRGGDGYSATSSDMMSQKGGNNYSATSSDIFQQSNHKSSNMVQRGGDGYSVTSSDMMSQKGGDNYSVTSSEMFQDNNHTFSGNTTEIFQNNTKNDLHNLSEENSDSLTSVYSKQEGGKISNNDSKEILDLFTTTTESDNIKSFSNRKVKKMSGGSVKEDKAMKKKLKAEEKAIKEAKKAKRKEKKDKKEASKSNSNKSKSKSNKGVNSLLLLTAFKKVISQKLNISAGPPAQKISKEIIDKIKNNNPGLEYSKIIKLAEEYFNKNY